MMNLSTNPSSQCCPPDCDCFSSAGMSYTYTSWNNKYTYHKSKDNSVKEITRNVLEKGFISVVRMKNNDFYLIGNGHTILSAECHDKETECGVLTCPNSFVEINVFPQALVTLKGIIPMPQERYVIVYGEMYLAFISYEQIFSGGDLCRSRVVSTERTVVGGRRTGMGKIQIFYENGSFETVEVKMKKSTILARSAAKKLGLNGAKITCINDNQSPVFLGTSSGQILSVEGKVLLRSNPSRGAVRQITPITDHLLVVLFENHSFGLLNTRNHSLRSVQKGRFTSIETNFQKDVLIGGDMDGNLYSFQIDNDKATLVPVITVKSAASKGKIAKLVAVDKDTVAITTEMGQFETIGRATFRPFKKTLEIAAPLKFTGSCCVKTTKGRWFILQDGAMYTGMEDPSCQAEKWNVVAAGPFHTLKHYKEPDSTFEVVYAYGNYKIFIDYLGKGPNQSMNFKNADKPKLFFSTQGMMIHFSDRLTFYTINEKNKCELVSGCSHLGNTSGRTTAFARIKPSSKYFQAVYAFDTGEILYVMDETKPNGPPVTEILEIAELYNDYVVSIVTDKDNILMLTAKGKFLTFGEKDPRSKSEKCDFVQKSATFLKNVIGRGYEIVKRGRNVAFVGFKQNILNIYKRESDQVFSFQTAGSKSWYILEDHQNRWKISYSLCGRLIERMLPSSHRQIEMDFPHTSSIRCAAMVKPKDDDYSWRVITGDDQGLLCVFTCSTGLDLKLNYYSTHKLHGAIRAIATSGNLVVVGTSTGALYLYDSTHPGLFLLYDTHYHFSIASINFLWGDGFEKLEENTFSVCRENGAVLVQQWNSEEQILDSVNAWRLSILSEGKRRNKWLYIDPPLSYGKAVGLADDGLGYSGLLKSSNLMRGLDRYSYLEIKNGEQDGELPCDIPETSLVQTCAGFSDGQFLHLVNTSCGKVHSFYYDHIHTDEIIDVIYWVIDTQLFLASLDITGVVVVRKLFCKEGGIFPNEAVPPMKFYTAVPQPRKMFYLPKIQDIVIFGKGVASIRVERCKFYTKIISPRLMDQEDNLFELD